MTDAGKRRWVTSLEVARLAGVSRSAVSRSFTPGASITDETRWHVLEAAEQLGYRPDAIARNLNMRHS
jgi:DNA-binding LacI/PurR family transcriptional regulator